MVSFKIKLRTVNNAALFIAKCGTYDFDIDLKYNRYIIDAKSTLGVMSISPDCECLVDIHTDDEELIERFKEDIKLWLIGER